MKSVSYNVILPVVITFIALCIAFIANIFFGVSYAKAQSLFIGATFSAVNIGLYGYLLRQVISEDKNISAILISFFLKMSVFIFIIFWLHNLDNSLLFWGLGGVLLFLPAVFVMTLSNVVRKSE